MTSRASGVRLVPLVLAVFLLQEAVLRGLRIDGVRPDLLLGLGVGIALVGGPEIGAVVAFAGALLGDLFVNTPLGLTALVACACAYVAGSVQAALHPNQRWSVPLLTAIASAAAEMLWAVLGTVLGLPGLLQPRLVAIVAVVALVNAIVSIPALPLLRWATTPRTEQAAAA